MGHSKEILNDDGDGAGRVWGLNFEQILAKVGLNV